MTADTATATTIQTDADTGTADTVVVVPVHVAIAADVFQEMNVKELKNQLKTCLQPLSGIRNVRQERLKVALENKKPYYTNVHGTTQIRDGFRRIVDPFLYSFLHLTRINQGNDLVRLLLIRRHRPFFEFCFVHHSGRGNLYRFAYASESNRIF